MACPETLRNFGLGALVSVAMLAAVNPAFAAPPPTSITLDGTLGQVPGNISATSAHLFTISPTTVGKTGFTGANLFESFGTFNLGTGDTAAFTSNPGTSNIIARVTGGSASAIDGAITSTTNLFFINPAGVMFTSNATVDVAGSFVVSTANYAKLNDGNIFYADVNHPVADAGLTASPISAFGFMSATPAPILFMGANIGGQPTSDVTGIQVIGGDITLDAANLLTPNGYLTLFSAAGTGEVPFSLTPADTEYASTGVTQFGAISLINGAQAEIDGNGGGALIIRGGKITVDSDALVTSGNSGALTEGNMTITADDLTITGGGFVATDTFEGAQGGSINVTVKNLLEISGADSQGNSSQISVRSDSSGPGGVATIMAGSIDLNGGDIFASTNTPGHAGNVDVTAGSMTMEGNSRLSSISDGPGNAGTVNLTLTSGALTMSDTAAILANTYISGQGGDINIMAPQVNMNDLTLISANTIPDDQVPVAGNGGRISVVTDSLVIQGSGFEDVGLLGITAQTLSNGNGGVIDVTAGTVKLSGNAAISAASQPDGKFGSGNAGSVSVTADQIELSDGSTINASSDETNAGSIQVTASTSLSLYGNSSLNTSAGRMGGSINLKVGHLLYLYDSSIEAFAGKAFASLPESELVGISGGNINIDPDFVILNDGLISANDLSGFGHDGNIINNADFFFTSDSVLHATGTIETTSPDLDLANSLAFLPANLVSAENELRERCDRAGDHEFSTFIVVGRGGIENGPEEYRPDFGAKANSIQP